MIDNTYYRVALMSSSTRMLSICVINFAIQTLLAYGSVITDMLNIMRLIGKSKIFRNCHSAQSNNLAKRFTQNFIKLVEGLYCLESSSFVNLYTIE